MENPHRKKILKTIARLAYSHTNWEIFTDFVELSALSISNSVDKRDYDKREERYLATIGKYKPDEQKLFPEMFADLVEALQYELTWSNAPVDVLGKIFHELELHNKYKGQFFTPQNVCDMMGKIALGENQSALNEKGYISMSEPCCGSGAMVLGFARAMLDAELNYCTQLVVTATDIDLKCVHMCYLQLALYGIPAVVIHGNTITLEEWSYWFTPVYILHGWGRRSGTGSNIERGKPKQPANQEPQQLTLFEEEN